MDLRHLSYFLEVAKQKSFTKASETLHVSQPSISKMVKDLETELGVSLIDRSFKQIELTDAGEVVLERAQRIIQSTDLLLDELDDLMNIKRGKISIGLPPMAGARRFPKILGEFNEKYPAITMQLVEMGAKKVESLVEMGEVDIGVVLSSECHQQFESFRFGGNFIVLAVHSNHPLAYRESVSLEELREERFIMFPEDFSLQQLLLDHCEKAGFHPHIVYQSSQWDFICQMVLAKLGIAFLPESITRELKYEDLRTVSLTPSIRWELSLIWRKDKYLSFAAREWIKFAQERL
ncbi:LysR family transcriptional regulator [Brevibacillus ginsengisoli]|uniref:LysR family transcriptional regulator n=1 Tax=Brevibacillus ginsengisoli TaxID=363854 RepID=UPI003CF16FF9